MSQTIWAIGRNYKDHAAEMNAPLPQKPLVFLKAMATLSNQAVIKIPNSTNNLHHELELAILLDKDLQPEKVALALDLTARDCQNEAKEHGWPWSLAKSFKGACPISTWLPYKGDDWFQNLKFQLKVDGETKQSGDASDMIFNLQEILSYLKENFPLSPGDIVLTGTPSGVGPLTPGNQLECRLEDQLTWILSVE